MIVEILYIGSNIWIKIMMYPIRSEVGHESKDENEKLEKNKANIKVVLFCFSNETFSIIIKGHIFAVLRCIQVI